MHGRHDVRRRVDALDLDADHLDAPLVGGVVEHLAEPLRAVIASEDDGFAEHGGVDWDALKGAWHKNEKAQARTETRREWGESRAENREDVRDARDADELRFQRLDLELGPRDDSPSARIERDRWPTRITCNVDIERLAELLSRHRGDRRVFLELDVTGQERPLRVRSEVAQRFAGIPQDVLATAEEAALNELRNSFGGGMESIDGGAAAGADRRDMVEHLENTLSPAELQQLQQEVLAIHAADFTPGEADRLRRAMAAWKRKGGLEPFEQRLRLGMLANGYSEDFAQRVFSQICGFGEYGFPESHAASFALLVYVSAWLKRHEPAAFAAALINSQPMGFYAPATLVSLNAPRRPVEGTCGPRQRSNHSPWL